VYLLAWLSVILITERTVPQYVGTVNRKSSYTKVAFQSIHTYHSRFNPKGVAEASRIDAQVLIKIA
jgi:hypothetical protein